MSQVDLLPKQDSLQPVPRVLFLPHALAESILLNLDNIDILFKFNEANTLLGTQALGCLVHVNSLYNSQDSIFLKSEKKKYCPNGRRAVILKIWTRISPPLMSFLSGKAGTMPST